MARSVSIPSVAFAVVGLLPALSSAALITGASVSSPTIPADLTDLGGVDWAYWDTRSGTEVGSLAPSNKMSGGAGLIGIATPVNATGVRGSSTETGVKFAFDNGSTLASSSSRPVVGVFSSQLGTIIGRGVQISITLPDTESYKVSLFVSGYFATGRLTASLQGATSYVDSSFSYTGTKHPRLYELTVSPDQAGDPLTVSYVTSAANDANSHVLIAGVAIAAVPEPAAIGLLAPLGFLALRRRSSTH